MTPSRPILVFDLDDTLFDELSYVRSGLRRVAESMAGACKLPAARLYESFLDSLAAGRSHVFDRAYAQLGCLSASLISRSVRIYRTHRPEIRFYPEAEKCLQRYARSRKFLVTDGNSTSQSAKVDALQLRRQMEHIYITYRYGRHHSKPSSHCFELICKRTGCGPEEVVYIGDNPLKDFLGIRPLGFRTIRVLTGQHRQVRVRPEHDAELAITKLSELQEALVELFGTRQANCLVDGRKDVS